ncbi:KpsF/GutQ family sugar-phosphate isomerase [Acetohalobium arabaticum]|uniref:KpsF/GutQ family protein n=1 Tax=Acetohalobium arabaticum (strain ATCC 49924 / DSM 5501 / Z-7288) TaxID=574087 RepID=D9QTU8_ACEAZ|nr:KpsF/GutQ family sugar-phosphate isomerase [Acetohalobium arabaticum]ADL13669.1 KpsF/GutQ family protein [Acetohalobium arabaticum DSM 5501]
MELDADQIKSQAKRVLDIEKEAIENLSDSINGTFVELVEVILNCSGRVVMTGMGKSGLIAKKLAATFSSTGTPSFFLHPGEAVHGDLGMVTAKDIVIALSNSGETTEVIQILPVIKRIGARIIALTGNIDSTLAENADYFLDTSVEQEACPLDLAPTASTTATLALGDALAIALLESRGFEPEDFALYHPGGSLGKRLLLKVEDVMHVRERNPIVTQDQPLKKTLFTMTSTQMGAANIVNEAGKLVGVITDGDVRRKLEESPDLLQLPAKQVMTADPVTITADKLAVEAVKIMQDKEINDLPVINDEQEPIGMVNFQDLLKAGVF